MWQALSVGSRESNSPCGNSLVPREDLCHPSLNVTSATHLQDGFLLGETSAFWKGPGTGEAAGPWGALALNYFHSTTHHCPTGPGSSPFCCPMEQPARSLQQPQPPQTLRRWLWLPTVPWPHPSSHPAANRGWDPASPCAVGAATLGSPAPSPPTPRLP